MPSETSDRETQTTSYLDVQPGDTVIWTDHGGQQVGTAVADQKWSGGLRIGGRSVKNIWEDATDFRVVKP